MAFSCAPAAHVTLSRVAWQRPCRIAYRSLVQVSAMCYLYLRLYTRAGVRKLNVTCVRSTYVTGPHHSVPSSRPFHVGLTCCNLILPRLLLLPKERTVAGFITRFFLGPHIPGRQYVTRARRSHGARSLRASCYLSRTHPFLSIDAVLVLTPARGVRPTASATLLTVGLHGWSSPPHPPSLGPAGYAMWYLLALPPVSGDPHA